MQLYIKSSVGAVFGPFDWNRDRAEREAECLTIDTGMKHWVVEPPFVIRLETHRNGEGPFYVCVTKEKNLDGGYDVYEGLDPANAIEFDSREAAEGWGLFTCPITIISKAEVLAEQDVS